MLFLDRVDAGCRLAARLEHLRHEDVVVVGLPRGGVPVAAEVARALAAPLDVLLVRKLGVPFQPELAMGALAEGGFQVVTEDVVASSRVTPEELEEVETREGAELDRRAEVLRRTRPRVLLAGRTVVLVDDGIATGSTVRAACQAIRSQAPHRIVLAVPVAPAGWMARLEGVADEMVALATPVLFGAVGQWYVDFTPTTDEEVLACLDRRRVAASSARVSFQAGGGTAPADDLLDDPPERDENIELQVGTVRLGGHLTVPTGASGLVVFVHGSGSGRHSPRNRYVALMLNRAGLGTLLFDLLTLGEERERANVFDIELLAARLAEVTRWLRAEPEGGDRPIGYFGASTGAAAALWAASEPGADIAAVVSRGGRPDLAAPRLAAVSAPTLLVVGGDDRTVLDLNRDARLKLNCENDLSIVPGASHLFDEQGALARVARLSCAWFLTHFAPVPSEVH